MTTTAADLKRFVREVPDFPRPGIGFKDITPLLGDPAAFAAAIDGMVALHGRDRVEKVVGIESRGFLLATAVAYRLKAGVVPVRKKGKLPRTTVSMTYQLEYGEDTLEMHSDALRSGERTLIVDDVLATGGTAAATCGLVEKLGAEIVGLSFLIELAFLDGRARLAGRRVTSLIRY